MLSGSSAATDERTPPAGAPRGLRRRRPGARLDVDPRRTGACPRPGRRDRYSARATPAWTELGLELTAAGHHELAARTEDALGRLREARDQPAPDTAALAEAHRALHAELAAAETGQVSVLARIEGALVRLEGGPLPEAGPVRPPGQEPPPLEASPGP